MAEALGSAYVVHLDDFILKDKLSEPSWEEGFDGNRLAEQVLKSLGSGQGVRHQQLLYESNTLGNIQMISPVEYLIVEGISSSHPDIAMYYDYKIWVDMPIDVAKARGKARDAGNENESMWDLCAENDLKYVAQHNPEAIADIIVNGY
ncbi:MAG TPA: hypothetical protein VK983_00980 [Candidatus Limnocylindrales bacterium]|nr:hypothetical protein [Candidatus Limnocylindrales bacterium]